MQHAVLTRFERNEDGNELFLVPFGLTNVLIQIAASVRVSKKNQTKRFFLKDGPKRVHPKNEK